MVLIVIAMAINSTLNSGVRVWRKINHDLPQEDVNIFFDKFTTDLHNMLPSADSQFIGKKQELELDSLVASKRFSGKPPGKIAYVYNEQTNILSRKAKDYSAVYNDEDGMVIPVLKNIQSLIFTYYFFDAQNKDFRWLEEWKREGLPRAVRVELEIKDGEKFKKFTRTVTIPVAI